MESQNSTTTNTQTTSRDYTGISPLPVFETVKSNLPTLLVLCGIVGLFYVLFYRVDSLERVQAVQDIQQDTIEKNQQEILTRLAIIETKQDRNTTDITQILNEIKRIK